MPVVVTILTAIRLRSGESNGADRIPVRVSGSTSSVLASLLEFDPQGTGAQPTFSTYAPNRHVADGLHHAVAMHRLTAANWL